MFLRIIYYGVSRSTTLIVTKKSSQSTWYFLLCGMLDEPEKPAAESALERMVDEYARDLFRYARQRVSDYDTAEDLVQETFVAAIRGYDSFRGGSSERTWLTGILKHKIVDHYRRDSRDQKRYQTVPEPGELEKLLQKSRHWNSEIGPLDWTADPAALNESRELFETLRRCLEELPQRMGAVFRMRMLEELSSSRLCETFHCTPENLRMILHRARFQLRRCLETNWFTDHKSGTAI